MDEVILTRIRQEAYDKGYQDGKIDGYNLAGTQMSLAKQERKKGKWIKDFTEPLGNKCSICGKGCCRFDFCPNCGADMRGDAEKKEDVEPMIYPQVEGVTPMVLKKDKGK